MLHRLFPHPWLAALLFGVWLLMTDIGSPGNWLLGAALGCGIALVAARRLALPSIRLRRPSVALRLAGHVAIDIVRANLHVAWLVLGRASRLRPGFIEVPLEPAHALSLSTLIGIVSLSPGTVCAELSDDRRRLLIHVLHLRDADELVAHIKSRYEAPLLEILPCSTS